MKSLIFLEIEAYSDFVYKRLTTPSKVITQRVQSISGDFISQCRVKVGDEVELGWVNSETRRSRGETRRGIVKEIWTESCDFEDEKNILIRVEGYDV